MKVLWVTPKWTIPANDGARVASYKLLSNLKNHNIEIDYLALSHPEDQENKNQIIEEFGLTDAFFIKRRIPQSLFEKIIFYCLQIFLHPLTPLTISSFKTREIKKYIEQILKQKEYDFIIADGLHCLGPLDNSFDQNKIIYRSHNVEADIWKKACIDTTNPFKKMTLFYQYFLMKNFEKKALFLSHLTLPISEDDKIVFEEIIPKSKMQVIPIGMKFTKTPKKETISPKKQFLFLGRIDWPPNRDGLKWFLDKVYPNLDLSQIHLHIAGSGNREWLKDYHHLQGITFHGYVDSIEDLYGGIDCSLIPIFYGSGTRIKVIEAYSFAKPIISTKMGALGSSLEAGKDYEECETVQEWSRALNNYNQNTHFALANNAITKLKKTYDEVEIAHKLFTTLS